MAELKNIRGADYGFMNLTLSQDDSGQPMRSDASGTLRFSGSNFIGMSVNNFCNRIKPTPLYDETFKEKCSKKTFTAEEKGIIAGLTNQSGQARVGVNAIRGGSEEGASIEAGATIPSALRFNADGFGSQYDAAGLVRPYALASGGQSTNGDNTFNGIAPRISFLGRKKMSDNFMLSYGGRMDYAHYAVNDSNSILKDENKFSLHRFTVSAVVRGALTVHKHFAIYGEVAPGLRLSTGSGRIATGAPEGASDENAFTADKVPRQIVAEGSLGFQVGPRDSVHVNAHIGWVGSGYDFTQQTVSVEGASSPVKVTNDGGILTGGVVLVVPLGGGKK